MYALLTLDVARDAVAEQFTYGEPLSSVVEADRLAPSPRAPAARWPACCTASPIWSRRGPGTRPTDR
jgi:hypothetical protein